MVLVAAKNTFHADLCMTQKNHLAVDFPPLAPSRIAKNQIVPSLLSHCLFVLHKGNALPDVAYKKQKETYNRKILLEP